MFAIYNTTVPIINKGADDTVFILSLFFRRWNRVRSVTSLDPYGQWQLISPDMLPERYIIMTSTGLHDGVSKRRKIDCLFNSLFTLTWKKSKLRITGPLLGKHLSPADSPHKGEICTQCSHVLLRDWSESNLACLTDNYSVRIAAAWFKTDLFKNVSMYP